MNQDAGNSGSFGRADALAKQQSIEAQKQQHIVAKTATEMLKPETPPEPPKKKKRSDTARSRWTIFGHFVISIMLFAALAGIAVILWGQRSFDRPGPLTSDTSFVVKKGTGLNKIASDLAQKRIISSSRVFRLGVRASGAGGEMKAGEYLIPGGASMRDVMELLKSGRSVDYALTIPEGLTVAQAMRRIAANDVLVGDMPETLPPEGWLLTDTQSFTRGTTRKEYVERLVAGQRKLVEEIWARRAPDLPLADINEFVTLASIVEKETGVAAERPRVAAVFVNRLRRGMRLQSDPTIIYGIFGGEGKPADRPIYRSDIDTPTPYNTYTIDGLPPTPIANPGKATLEALANPANTNDLFFVADGTGGHAFAETLEQHNANVARWRQIEQERKQQQENASGG